MTKQTQASHRSLDRCVQILKRTQSHTRLALFAPLPFSLLAVASLQYFDPLWTRNPFLLLLLALFIWGQIAAFRQLLSISRQSKQNLQCLAILENLDSHSQNSLSEQIEKQPTGHLRDLLLAWLSASSPATAEKLFENARDRRDQSSSRLLGFHVLLNRNIMKLGFIGTLIGLMLTFPPMKRAMLGLTDSDGELRFIQDIAKAIDEDAYAILATLIATGFSLFLEALVLQGLERILSRFDDLDSHLADWNLLVLQPWIHAQNSPNSGTAPVGTPTWEQLAKQQEQRWQNLSEEQIRHEAKIIEAQKLLSIHLDQLSGSVEKTGEVIQGILKNQQQLVQRVQELNEFESQYRKFLNTKQDAIAPSHLRPVS